MKSCRFVSDLHLFSTRSRGADYEGAIYEAAANSDEFVLLGDIFDLHWSTLGEAEESAIAAKKWLMRLLRTAANTRIHVLLGNHDHHPAMIQKLKELDGRFSSFNWHPYYIRLGGGVFLHGDAANFGMTSSRLESFRDRCAAKPLRNPRLSPLYDFAIRARLHAICARAVFPHRIVADRLKRYLDEIGQGPETGVRNVYFGHTHRALDGYERHGLRFHNCGAPIDGLNFNILEADIC